MESENELTEKELLEVLPHSPMIEPEKPAKKTKLQIFIEELSKYPDKESAKLAIPEIAEKLGCSKALGYKALTKVSKFIGETPIEQAKEPTVKIPKAPEIEITETEIGAEGVAPTPTPEIPQAETIPSAPSIPTFPMTADKLETTFDILFSKLADLTHYPDFKLEKRESQALAEAWLPVLQQYAPQMIANPTVWASFTTIIIIAPRIIGYWQTRRKTEKIIETPKPQPQPETKPPMEKNERESERESTEAKPTELPKPEQVGFYKELMRSG